MPTNFYMDHAKVGSLKNLENSGSFKRLIVRCDHDPPILTPPTTGVVVCLQNKRLGFDFLRRCQFTEYSQEADDTMLLTWYSNTARSNRAAPIYFS